MNGLIWLLFVVLLVTVSCSGQTLRCFKCELGFWDVCHTTKTNCTAGQQCFVGIGSAASVVKIKMMGCLPQEDCNKTTQVEFSANKTLYKMVNTCCNQDFCNGGPNVLVSLTVIALSIGQMMCWFL